VELAPVQRHSKSSLTAALTGRLPYVCDQLAMSRLPRASFAFLLALLPASATLIGIIVLRQLPSAIDVAGVLLVMIGVAVHKPRV